MKISINLENPSSVFLCTNIVLQEVCASASYVEPVVITHLGVYYDYHLKFSVMFIVLRGTVASVF